MPELPEVHTTVTGLQKVLPGLVIRDVWTDLAKKNQKIKHFRGTLKEEKFYKYFKKTVSGAKVISAERRAKNILINLSNGQTILIHLKMTGHLLFGKYKKQNSTWVPDQSEKNQALRDPYNRFVHVAFTLSNGKHLVFSDARKFGKVTLLPTKTAHETIHLKGIGPEPLDKTFSEAIMIECLLKKPSGKIKQVLMDQSVIAGIGNIYSDEMLWLAGIHPLSRVEKIPPAKMSSLYKGMREVLKKGIDFGGDSMSDYRNIHGKRGEFQHKHNVYQLRGKLCKKHGCKGVITRIVIGSRSAHFCPIHQKLYN